MRRVIVAKAFLKESGKIQIQLAHQEYQWGLVKVVSDFGPYFSSYKTELRCICADPCRGRGTTL